MKNKAPKTFEYQDKLPRLPVPDLEKSLEGYLRSLTPFLEQKYGPSALPKELEKRKLFAKDFASKDGIGRVLQNRLKDLDEISPNNWLDDSLWLALAYHTWRAPLIINSNWWLLYQNDPGNPEPPVAPGATNEMPFPIDTNPRQPLPAGSQGGGKEWIEANKDGKNYYSPLRYDNITEYGWISDWQVRRAAWLVSHFAKYRNLVDREQIPPDVSRAGPYDMAQYKKLFNISRIPMAGSDALSVQDNQARHVTVMIDDFVYSVDVFAREPAADGIADALPPAEVERLLQSAVADAKARKDGGEKPAQVGILTADERDIWTVNREQLLLISDENRKTMDNINRSLIGLFLDPYTIPTQPFPNDPLRFPQVDAQMHNAQSGLHGGQNRWFDKALNIVIETNGRASTMGEHSPVDALIPSFVLDYALANPVDNSQFPETKQPLATKGDGFEPHNFVINEEMQREIEGCRQRNKAIVADSDGQALWFGEYGTEWIKKVAKLPPDAFIQQVLQLAWYRDQGYTSATYETASTRAFKHGRTEVIRSASPESRQFVLSMSDPKADGAKRLELLAAAANMHNKLTKQSSMGEGYDRHLMGLKVQLRPGETHPLFEDELYALSQEWKLSTSGLSAGIRFMATGFGSPFLNGYGLNYMAGPNLIKFGLESKVECPKTSTSRFKHQIVQAFRDLRALVEESAPKAEAKL